MSQRSKLLEWFGLEDRVAIVTLAGGDIEQQHRDTGIGDLCGDPRAHHAGADHADLANSVGHHARSSTVAMP